MNELALFAGAGGGIQGGQMLGWRTVCAVEYDQYAASVLCARQNDGTLEAFPIWSDIQTFDGKPWRGIVDVVSGGFPCQDISAAGSGAGIEGERSGLWSEMARIVGEVRPQYVWVENSPLLVQRGLALVLRDLAALGYDAKWGIVGAHNAGAPHKRDRCWLLATDTNIQPRTAEQTHQHQWAKESSGSCQRSMESSLADSDSIRELQPQRVEQNERRRVGDSGKDVADSNCAQCKRNERSKRVKPKYTDISGPGWWAVEPQLGRVANGVAYRVDRLKAIGNGQVPQAMKLAWEILTGDV